MLLSGTGPAGPGDSTILTPISPCPLAVGVSASGFGWALVIRSRWSPRSPRSARPPCAAARPSTSSAAAPSGSTGTLGLLVLLGLLAYVTRRDDGAGRRGRGRGRRLALTDVVDRATPASSTATSRWPGPATAAGVLAVGLVFFLRRNAERTDARWRCRRCSALFTFSLPDLRGGWFLAPDLPASRPVAACRGLSRPCVLTSPLTGRARRSPTR